MDLGLHADVPAFLADESHAWRVDLNVGAANLQVDSREKGLDIDVRHKAQTEANVNETRRNALPVDQDFKLVRSVGDDLHMACWPSGAARVGVVATRL